MSYCHLCLRVSRLCCRLSCRVSEASRSHDTRTTSHMALLWTWRQNHIAHGSFIRFWLTSLMSSEWVISADKHKKAMCDMALLHKRAMCDMALVNKRAMCDIDVSDVIWVSHVCCICEWVVSMSCCIFECDVSTRRDLFKKKNEGVMPLVWMHHVTYKKEPYRTWLFYEKNRRITHGSFLFMLCECIMAYT